MCSPRIPGVSSPKIPDETPLLANALGTVALVTGDLMWIPKANPGDLSICLGPLVTGDLWIPKANPRELSQ